MRGVALLLAAWVGCSSDPNEEPRNAAVGDGGAAMVAPDLAPPLRTLILGDTNRDGVVTLDDNSGHGTWNDKGGALMLANLDDDDRDGVPDGEDTLVNGATDALDLAMLKVWPWPSAPDGVNGRLTLEGDHVSEHVRIFRKRQGLWSLLGAAKLTAEELREGVELGVEANDFVQTDDPDAWDGYANVRLEVFDGGTLLLADVAALRVAPFVMISTITPTGVLWASPYAGSGGDEFWNDLTSFAQTSTTPLTDSSARDQWAEDYWQFGHTFIPAAGNKTQGMLIAQRSAQPDREAGGVAELQLGPDVGFIWPRGTNRGQPGKAYSMDSFGNHDTIPPYTLGSERYPLGRILVGGNAVNHIDSAVRAFYDAQSVQPVLQVDTDFLIVGHVDEIFSFVPAATPRGWKLLVASPSLARTMLQGWQTAGQGSVKLFNNKNWYIGGGRWIPASVSIAALLLDSEVMAASQFAQTKIDAALGIVKSATGLGDDEIIPIPFLYTRELGWSGAYEVVAHMVGTVNLRVVNGKLAIPDPQGPILNGTDALKKDLLDRLGNAQEKLGQNGQGLPISFVEDWDHYHVMEGEVHCGTTVSSTPPSNVAWWEAGR